MVAQVRDGKAQSILERTQLASLFTNFINGMIQSRNGILGIIYRKNIVMCAGNYSGFIGMITTNPVTISVNCKNIASFRTIVNMITVNPNCPRIIKPSSVMECNSGIAAASCCF